MSITNNYKNLIFEGGGIKAIAFTGVLQVLEAQSALNEIKEVVGTSAGAIIATLIALNYKSEEITKIILDTNFKKFEDGFNPFRLINSYGIYKGDKIKKWIENKISNAGIAKNATFQMLSENSNYRNLRIFATDLNTQSLQEFSASQTPHTIIAEAVRASISIPLLFKSWQFSNKQPNDHIYVDGGIFFNNSINTFQNIEETLSLYVNGPQRNKKKNNLSYRSPSQYASALYDTLVNSRNLEYQNSPAHQKHSIIINNINVSATDFGISAEMKRKLISKGKEAAEKFLGVNRLFD